MDTDKAIQEIKLLNKPKISDIEFFKVWNKYLYGHINMLKFKEILLENGIEVEERS